MMRKQRRQEHKKKWENTNQEDDLEGEGQVHDELESPLEEITLKIPRRSSFTFFRMPESWSVSPQPLIRNKGKQPVMPKPLTVQERSEPSQLSATDRTQSCATRRTESDSMPSPIRLRDKGKGPLSPQIARREKSSISERPYHALRFKEPKVGPGIVLLPKQKVPDTHNLIKPKDEPITDDMPQFEVPIAVIRPESLSKGNSSIANGSIREPDGLEPLASESVDGEDKSDGIPAPSSETRTNCELANILDESSANLEIASSPYGEVKISLSCNSALGSPDFHMPSIHSVLKLVEDKCLRSYQVLDPNFSVMKLMRDMCECFLELGTNSSDESRETTDVTPSIDLLKKSNVPNALGARSVPSSPLNGSVAQPLFPKLSSSFSVMDDSVQPDKNVTANGCEIDKEKEQNCFEDINSRSLVVVKQCQLTPDHIRSLHDVNDIAKRQERVVISLCGNRVVQRGINCKLQVFMTPKGKGWGLRTLEELPKGAFVCEYVGEVLTNSELYERISQSSSSEEHAYPVQLDADWGSESVLKDEEALCLDATYYGNVARFINHRCFDSNLVEIPVEVETPDHHYYHLAFFTTRKVEALEELTWDYGIDFDDHDHLVKAFRCRCGSKLCRSIKRPSMKLRSRNKSTGSKIPAVVENKEPTTSVEKSRQGRKYLTQYRSNMAAIVKLVKSIKLQAGHIKALRKTPFWNLFDAIISGKVDQTNIKKSDNTVLQILGAYKPQVKAFQLGKNIVHFRESDITLIFGIKSGQQKMMVTYGKKPTTSFVKRRFPSTTRLTATTIKEKLLQALKGKKRTDIEDVARLLSLYLCLTLLFSTTGTSIGWIFVQYIEDLEKISKFAWVAAIRDSLMSSIERLHQNPEKITGCVTALLVKGGELQKNKGEVKEIQDQKQDFEGDEQDGGGDEDQDEEENDEEEDEQQEEEDELQEEEDDDSDDDDDDDTDDDDYNDGDDNADEP
ncbi:hypothetical protein F0562_021091 [Nyssa sinensis]|uniref:SET domain-containing protein n=1 Tax=Nyssa sinensis TaxID=561372 RepID=A0A5J5BKY6_9ASTE|nr:hypothetical protein F0562_021091 [Nyssa sinensis]